ncbi:MAG: phosphoribosylglycinamide formyltransferase [Candidatus Neomarinimicrobiota bacterium]|nr:MAG: phosphoribosylglycinamide formyltransferase [bacterium]|tara:strand:- start:2697 stop:3281 length:585 start_codon:yes stop_codon:yes gene_type:complete
MIKIGVLGSTRGTDLQAVIDSINKKELVAEVAVVISNKKGAYILKRAEQNKIPSVFLSHKGLKRKEFDRKITNILKKNSVELILLIGFMRVLSSDFCQEWRDRLINVHPSLLPKYAGGMDSSVHEEVIKNGEKETGCTIHFVTEDVDGGPILIQKKCRVDDDDTVETLKAKVQQLEGIAFIESIKLIQGNIYVK